MKTYPSIRISSQRIIATTFKVVPSDSWTQMHPDHLLWTISKCDFPISWCWNCNDFTGFQTSCTSRLERDPSEINLFENQPKQKNKSNISFQTNFSSMVRGGRLKMFLMINLQTRQSDNPRSIQFLTFSNLYWKKYPIKKSSADIEPGNDRKLTGNSSMK